MGTTPCATRIFPIWQSSSPLYKTQATTKPTKTKATMTSSRRNVKAYPGPPTLFEGPLYVQAA